MGRMPQLEDFDTADRGGPAGRGPSQDWLDGHAHGLQAGIDQAAAAQGQLSAEIAQTLADMAFGYAEARNHLLHALKPLFGALIGRLLPGLADTAMTAQLVEMIQSAATLDSGSSVELSVHPDRVAALTELLPYAVGLPIVLIADPSIGPGGAVLTSARGETALDIDTVIAKASMALAAIFDSDDERASYG